VYLQNQMISYINNLLNFLDKIQNISITDETNYNFKQSFEKIKNTILKNGLKIKNNIEFLSKNAEWDKLNVAFFGETNAGKSTIIEALTNGEGHTIGEGYKDFTLDVNIKQFKNINLVDMPGIEGKEYKVIKSIKEAVNKSHIIFYVIGTNKEPEENTINKIKSFLKDNAKVYTIINVRGKPSVYRRKNLIDKNVIEIEKRIIEKFSKILNKNYGGNFIINAYLALLANDHLKERFNKDQQKALNIFGNKTNIIKFSNIEKIYILLKKFENNFKNEIIISNSYKFLRQINIMLSQILKEKKNFDNSLKEMEKDVYKYLEKIENIFDKYKKEIFILSEIHFSSLKNNIKKIVNESINKEYGENIIKSKIKEMQKEKEKELNEKIKNILKEMEKEVHYTIKEFENRIALKIKFINFKGDFNVKEILEGLSYSFGEIFKEILDLGLSIWGAVIAFFIHPILGIIAGVISIVNKVWDWLVGNKDKKKENAKNKAIKKIDEEIIKIEKEVKNKLKRYLKKLNKETKKPIKNFKYDLWKLKQISIYIDKFIEQIQITQVKISLLLIKNFLGKEVEFAYIDLQLSKIVIIGFKSNEDTKKELMKLFRVKELFMFSTYNEFFNNAGQFIKDQFKARDEFYFRAVKSLLLYNNKFNIKKILK
jgi:GTP-binding protein EngB required for normal cell division